MRQRVAARDRQGPGASQSLQPSKRSAQILTTQKRLEMRDTAARCGWRPADYPPEWWDTEVCPLFAPPVNVFAYELGEHVPTPVDPWPDALRGRLAGSGTKTASFAGSKRRINAAY